MLGRRRYHAYRGSFGKAEQMSSLPHATSLTTAVVIELLVSFTATRLRYDEMIWSEQVVRRERSVAHPEPSCGEAFRPCRSQS